MDLTQLPSIFTDAEVALYAGAIAVIVGVLQSVSVIPMPEGSKARAWAVSIAAAIFVGLAAPGTELAGTQLALAVILSWAALAAASLGINRAGVATARTVQNATSSGEAQG